MPQIRLLPDDAVPHLVCRKIIPWPLQGRTVRPRDFPDVPAVLEALIAAGYTGDLVDLAGELALELL